MNELEQKLRREMLARKTRHYKRRMLKRAGIVLLGLLVIMGCTILIV